MSNPARRRPRLAAAFLVILFPALGACGFNEQTDQVYQPSVGVNNRSGTVDVLGAVVVSGTDGTGTFVASLDNKDQKKIQTLTGITGADGIEVTLVKHVDVPPGGLVNFADLGVASVHGHAIQAGGFARLTLEFESGQSAEVNAPVVAPEAQYSEIAPAIPSSSPTP
jgi:hypothetical protein